VTGRQGQAAIFMTMTLTVSLGLIGLVVDIGWAYWRKEACATAANAAAFAAISAASASGVTNQSCGSGLTAWDCNTYPCPANPSSIANNLDNGCLYAKQNGFLDTGRQTVTLQGGTSAPPAPGVTPAYWVTATVTERIPTLFSAALGQPWSQVASQSTAGMFKGGGGGCVYVLDPTANGAWTQSGGNFSTGCGIYINSNSGSALSMSGGNITLGGGADIDIVGHKSSTGGNIVFNGGGSLQTGEAPFTNPLTGLVAPTPASSCIANPNYSGGTNITIPSGTYCGISISGGTGFVISGTYIIKTGSFSVSGGNVSTGAGGATIYFPPAGTGNLAVTGGNMVLTAPTSGSLAGVAVWKDTVTPNTAAYTGGNLTINGIIDMPATALTYTGGSTPVQQSIIVDTITMTGGNISQPATSSYFSNGAAMTGNFIIQ
jgi:hypothetical protein